MKLTFYKEISRWDEGLPLGSGLLGALVWGKTEAFRIALGRSDLWDRRRSETFSSPSFCYREYVRLAKEGEAGKALFDSLFDAPYNLPWPTRIPAAALKAEAPPSEKGSFVLDTRRAEAYVRSENFSLRLFLGATEGTGRMRVEGDCKIVWRRRRLREARRNTARWTGIR